MAGPFALLALAAAAVQAPAPGVTFTNTVPPPVVLPPQSLPPAAMQPAHMVRSPQERVPTQSYVSPLDYPAEALGSGARGRVGFTLTIGPDGRVIGCTITQSSGSNVLDAATCRLMQRRARYTPAMDSNGNPVAGTIDQHIDWKAQR